MKGANGSLSFRYDGNGEAIGLRRGGQEYTYVKNLQGDIIGIANPAGEVVVLYNYDAYGRCLVVTGSMAETLGQLNPLRYRGYVYDNETGYYYLQSRYYDPEMGRFLNTDAIGGETGTLGSHNMFAYCANNPVNASDPTGHAWWHWALAAAVVVVAAVAVVATAGGALAGMAAESAVASGMAASSTAATVVAGAFIGASIGFGYAVADAVTSSTSASDFANRGGSALASTASGAAFGGAYGYSVAGREIILQVGGECRIQKLEQLCKKDV